ncbi:MAG: AMP-binding protein [Nocardioides sp.]
MPACHAACDWWSSAARRSTRPGWTPGALPGADRIRLLNTYGATETALISHAGDLHGPRIDRGVPASVIGRPLGHVRQLVADDGELLVGGPTLAVGYPGLAEETADRFVEHAGVRYFRTGDLVRPDDDGRLQHVGRRDAQVKVRGIRVDPGEVEAYLLRHPGVAAAAVTGVTLSGRTALAAYVVASNDRPADALVAEVRDHLRRHAPRHLEPARIDVVPSLVLTSSGKVDRRATHETYAVTPREGAAHRDAGKATA